MTPDQVDALIRALRSIAHGGTGGPTGLEAVAMSLAKSNEPTVAESMREVAAAIHDLADALRERGE